ncbi:MAG: hypothetical protein QOK34_1109, partial [Gaiellaceae bacterium]|nr:hypothetical protein [Gaiellaceae bacterium]
ELAEAMGGDVEVASSRAGAVFTIRLPLPNGASFGGWGTPRVHGLHAFTKR